MQIQEYNFVQIMETKANILIVDDNEDHCDGMKDYLGHEGYAADCAIDGKEAIALVQENTYDVALVDIKLPDIQGTELVKKLIDISPSIEFIHITAHASLDTAIRAVEQEHVVSYEIKPVDMNHLLSTLRQIMKRKKMEEALAHSEKLKSLGVITAGIAHEFNNILTVMVGSAEVLEGGFKDDKELKSGLRAIIKAGDDGAKIVKNMLMYAKSQSKDVSDHILFDIRDLLKEAIVFTRPRWKNIAQFKGKNYNINKEGMKKVPEVFCNTTELREVFINIINNALDAMPDGGSLSFSTWNNEDAVFIKVSDTGKGMSEEVRGKIFDPFFTTRRPLGTGLGMSISYGIMTSHGGKIEVESEEAKGTTINLSIPIKRKNAQQKPPLKPEAQVIKTRALNILVVDDNVDICKFLDKLLSREGHMVRTIYNGAEAITLAENVDYDLVLCDIAMPDVFGYDVVKALNKLGKRPKIGIITGFDEIPKPIDREGVEIDFVLKKPFNVAVLLKQINKAFDADLTHEDIIQGIQFI